MKIAFTSCISTDAFPGSQPVWTTIAQQAPDHLVLTGDSIYLDVPRADGGLHPKALSDYEFVQHGLRRYQRLLAQPEFSALVRQVPTDAIWDDHDFLWNEAYAEKAITKKVYAGQVRGSRALFNAYRRSLAARLAPGSFPSLATDPVLWQDGEPAPGYSARRLAPGLVLHLTDGRSQRVNRTLLGSAQREQIATEMAAHGDDTVHLLASGSVVEAHKGDHWTDFEDYAWLLQLAQRHKILVLSGDIHENRFMALDAGGGHQLFDATASGAAVYRGVTIGSPCQNFGLLTIDAQSILVDLQCGGQHDQGAPFRIDRASWQRVAV